VVRVQERLGLPFLLLQPLAALTFYITMVAELERIPFDIPEADSEIVAGWVTEYSGVNHLLLYGGAPVIKLYAFSGLFTTLFLGGWLGPPPIPPDLWFHLKTFLVILSVQALRAIYPRYRIDQLLRIGWGTLLMLALINLALTILLMGALQVV
jgi:NADH-quinone oxidoreductase subunit H